MSWSIYCNGSPKAVISAINKAYSYPEEGDQTQIDAAKEYMIDEISLFPPGVMVSVKASGHHNDGPSPSRQVKIDIEPIFITPEPKE
jgi:hypothetical protein